MTMQPRQPAGTHQGDVSVAGRWTNKHAPDINEAVLGFGNDAASAMIGPPTDWATRTVKVWRLRTTFTRSVEDETVSVTTDCEPPDMMLLARKGDADYWSGNTWVKHHRDRRLWSADITRQMLQEGLIATKTSDGIQAAMTAASSPAIAQVWAPGHDCPSGQDTMHVLTVAVAQIRGLRLIQAMAPGNDWNIKFGGHTLRFVDRLLIDRFHNAVGVYKKLPRPPWDDGVPWGPQTVAGHATGDNGEDIFVGEHGDLLWRALTETDHYGMSALKQSTQIPDHRGVVPFKTAMIVAAVLYDETAEQQLTTGLFDGAEPDDRASMRTNVLNVFAEALNPGFGECRWTEQQQDQIRGFIELVEALEP